MSRAQFLTTSLAVSFAFGFALSCSQTGGNTNNNGNSDTNANGNENGASTEVATSFQEALDASGNADATLAAAQTFHQAATALHEADPEASPDELIEIVAEQIQTAEDLEAYAEFEESISGEIFWLDDIGDDVSSARVQQSEDLPRVVPLYVNGINTSFVEAVSHQLALDTLLRRGPSGTRIDRLTGVGLYWNKSAKDEQFSFWGPRICPFFFAQSESLKNKCDNFVGIVGDSPEAVWEKVLEWFGNPTAAASRGGEVAPLATQVAENLQGGACVLLIGHSQGNFKIAQALNLLWANQDGWASSESEAQEVLTSCVGVVAIGCPADYQQAIDRGIRVKKFNIRKSSDASILDALTDVILWVALQLWNLDEDIVSLFDDSQPASEYLWGKHPEVEPGAANNLLFPAIHDLRESYLLFYGPTIRDDTKDLVDELGVDGDVVCVTDGDCLGGQVCQAGECVSSGAEPSVTVSLHRVSDTFGTMHTSSPGAEKSSFSPGETARVTLSAENSGEAVSALCVLNVAAADDHTDLIYDSHDPSLTPSGTVEDIVGGLSSGEIRYYSFDVVIPTNASSAYELGAALRDASMWDTVYDDTEPGPGTTTLGTDAWLTAFVVGSAEGCGGCPAGKVCVGERCVPDLGFICTIDADCNDGVSCNGVEVCSDGECFYGSDPCPLEMGCIEGTLECVADNCPPGGSPLSCYVIDTCEGLSLDHCNDGLFCNGVEYCLGGVCLGHPLPCLGRICNDNTDQCVLCATDADCDDGVYCNGVEVCLDGECFYGSDPCPLDMNCIEDTLECVAINCPPGGSPLECFVDP